MALPDYVQRRKGTFDVLGLLTTEDQSITATGSGSGLQVGKGAKFDINLHADTISGTTPTLDVVIEGSDTGAFGGEEETVVAFPQLDDSADPVEKQLAFESEHEYIRASWTIGGSGSPTFVTTISLRN